MMCPSPKLSYVLCISPYVFIARELSIIGTVAKHHLLHCTQALVQGMYRGGGVSCIHLLRMFICSQLRHMLLRAFQCIECWAVVNFAVRSLALSCKRFS